MRTFLASCLCVGCFNPDPGASTGTETDGPTGTGSSATMTSSPSTTAPTTATTTAPTTDPTSMGTTDEPATDTMPPETDTGQPACGDEVIDAGEDCDDGNTNAGDGCSAACLDETVFCEPTLEGASNAGRVGRMVAEGGYLYTVPVATVSGPTFRIFDVSDPALITMEGSFAFSTEDYPNNRMIGIAKAGDFVFLGGRNPELASLDVSMPSTPTNPFISGPNVTEGHAQISGDHLYLPNSIGELVEVWNISDGANPTQLAGAGDPGNPYYNSGVNGTHAFISTFTNQIDVVDISVPAATSVVGQYTHASAWNAADGVREIVANDNTVAVAIAGEGIVLLDVALPTVPDVGATINETPFDIAIRDTLLYVPYFDGLRVFDISNPSDPELAAAYIELDIDAYGVTYDDQFVYVSADNSIIVLSGMPGVCTAVCGNNTVEWPEDCDDGNLDDGDLCPATCEDADG